MDKQNQSVHTMRYYTIRRKNYFLTGVIICIDHEKIILSKYISFLRLHIILFHCQGFYRKFKETEGRLAATKALIWVNDYCLTVKV